MNHMSADISSIPPLPLMQDGGDRRRAQPAPEDERKTARGRAGATFAPPAGQSGDNGRLVIEEDQETGKFVYRIIDRTTGEVIKQFPREEVLRMQQSVNAVRGAILDKRV